MTTQKLLPSTPAAVARDKRHFGYRAGTGGLLVLDYDPPKGAVPLSPEALWHCLLSLWPEALQGIVCHWVSGSSLIHRGEAQLSGIGGQRLYIVVRAQFDIPRALRVLNQRAWLKGVGTHVHISAAGSMLPRSLFDAAMGEPARLDFAPAGAVCCDGLAQRRGPPSVLADGAPLDTRATLPDLSTADEAEVRALIEAAKLKAKPEAEARRASWLAQRQQAAVVAALNTGADPDEARQRVQHEHDALLGGVITGGAELIHVDDDGNEVAVTVDQLLRDPKRWHQARFLSPHDPDHRGRSPDAMAYLLQAVPTLYDLNDSIPYRLQAQPVRLQVTQGGKAQLADAIAAELAARSDLMTVAGQLVRVVHAEFLPVTRPMLSFLVGTHCALHRHSREGKAVAVDVDQPTIEMVHALLTERARKVLGRSSVPLIDLQGRVIDRPGHDDKSGLYLDLIDSPEPVPVAPTRAQTVAALRRLWKPWSLYEWATEHDRAAMLATVLTVPLRPTIDAAPGLFVDAASQGSGKSAAIAAVLALAQGHHGGMKTWTGDSEAELEKYLLALARAGAPAVAWDNVLGTFDSASIATAVVEGRVSARLLGATQALSPALRSLWLATGNNGALGRDCGTRFLQARIASSNGHHRKAFPFEPRDAAQSDRQGIVRAILIVHRAWHAAGSPLADAITTRFAAWGRVVRPMVQWLTSSGIAVEAGVGALGDPADSILNRDAASDPDTESATALLWALRAFFGTESFTAQDLLTVARVGKDSSDSEKSAVHDAVAAFFPRTLQGPTGQALSSLLRFRRDRTYAGLKLVMLPKGETRQDQRSGQRFAVIEA